MPFIVGLGRLLSIADELHYIGGHMCEVDPAQRVELRLLADRLNDLTFELRHG